MVTIFIGTAVILAGSVYADMASDEASNYSGGWDSSTTYGTGFSTWSFSQTGGYWVPNYSTDGSLLDFGNISSSDDRVLALNYGSGYINASRNINDWADGYTFSIDLATQWRNGGRGIDLQDSSDQILWTFNVSDLGYGATGWDYRNDMTLALTVVQNGSDLDITVNGASVADSWADTFSTSVSGTFDGFSLYAGDTGGDNNNALLVNNMGVIPEPAVMGLVLVFGTSILFGRRLFMR